MQVEKAICAISVGQTASEIFRVQFIYLPLSLAVTTDVFSCDLT